MTGAAEDGAAVAAYVGAAAAPAVVVVGVAEGMHPGLACIPSQISQKKTSYAGLGTADDG